MTATDSDLFATNTDEILSYAVAFNRLPDESREEIAKRILDMLNDRGACRMLGVDYTNPGIVGDNRARVYVMKEMGITAGKE